ncbi:hypothetical protein D7Z26_11240 [Cohnella endophytica]|uniref:Galactose mutarotase n=1 Tax=Cohnella endophytica TaxID=2419778 RepID=A0A494XY50_9BACL|nr:hypothetical protein [Cohnella endophytica]RKP53959.1 hypothetical protein D7Z26_11240 [Cohnella endophytica]
MESWEKKDESGFEAWTGGTSKLSVTVVPALGAKAVSLLNRATGREWLWSSGKRLGNRGYASPFGDSDESGWDEMFPGINACVYPQDPWEGISVPDHGEVWSLAWRAEAEGKELRCSVNGERFPYSLDKIYTFSSENTLRIDYTLTNKSASPFSFLWAAHPLFRAQEGMRLRVPEELREIEVSYSADFRLGRFGDRRPWPIPEVGVDLSVIEPPEGSYAEKYYFTDKLKRGWAELSDPVSGEAVEFRFPAERVPYLAIWANYGGYGGHYHFAIEPATGRMDDLAYAISGDEAATVEAGGRYRWYLELTVR